VFFAFKPKQLEKAETTCSLISAEESTFTVVEVIEKKLSKKLLIRRKASRKVEWAKGSDNAHCPCNALIHRGMPCVHTSPVDISKGDYENYLIPLSSFNARIWQLQLDFFPYHCMPQTILPFIILRTTRPISS